MHKMLLQSAMEYLMTYGWAILIIAVVLGALFQLGIFNSSTFTPKAPPGACHVFRPNGPGTTSFINTQGICNGELPQYAAYFDGTGRGALQVTPTKLLEPSSITVSAWVRPTAAATSLDQVVFASRGTTYSNYGYELLWGWGPTQPIFRIGTGVADLSAYTTSSQFFNTWVFVVGTYSLTANTINLYVDGASVNTVGTTPQITYDASQIYIGSINGATPFEGYISNIQVYNTSLAQSEITALYNEGIGGAPVKLNNLVGWWPLNGDAKDYSGNNNAATYLSTYPVSFRSTWESGYSAP